MKLEIETKEDYNAEEQAKLKEIVSALIKTGGLLGMKNGSTSIHFDAEGVFMGINHNYWPFRRRKL